MLSVVNLWFVAAWITNNIHYVHADKIVQASTTLYINDSTASFTANNLQILQIFVIYEKRTCWIVQKSVQFRSLAASLDSS